MSSVTLTYFTKDDFQQLIEWINTEEMLIQWSGHLFSFPLTQESLDWYIEGTNQPPNSDALVYKALNASGKTVGHISLGSISAKNQSARITRVFVDPQESGKGYCTEMVKLVLQIGFEELGLHRISLGVYSHLTSAIRCYQKAGMVLEGTHRDVLKTESGYWSYLEFSMLAEEWSKK